MAYTKEQLLETYKKLPEDVKDAIFSVDTSEVIREIGEKHKLMVDKIGKLADETGLVMLGLTHPNEFISNLAERLGVERDIAKEIAEDINSKVFFSIRENLKKIHGLAPTLAESEVGAPTPPEAGVGEVPPAPTPPAPTVVPEPPLSEPPAPLIPEEPKPEPEITTPPVIMSMPIDLTKAEKTQAEGETFPPAASETKTREEFFQPKETEKKEEKGEMETPEIKKVDPYREPTT